MSYDPYGSFDDWRWAGSGVNPPGVPVAAILTQVQPDEWHWVFGNNAVMAFPDQQITHEYQEGADGVPHIHWFPTTSGLYVGTWTTVFTSWLSVANGSPRQAPIVTTASFNANLVAGECVSQDFSSVISGLNRKISSVATLTLKLALTSGVGCGLLGFDGHMFKDRPGSRQVNTK